MKIRVDTWAVHPHNPELCAQFYKARLMSVRKWCAKRIKDFAVRQPTGFQRVVFHAFLMGLRLEHALDGKCLVERKRDGELTATNGNFFNQPISPHQ
jgi:hypothetical protein